jgi:hypothetical protein
MQASSGNLRYVIPNANDADEIHISGKLRKPALCHPAGAHTGDDRWSRTRGRGLDVSDRSYRRARADAEGSGAMCAYCQRARNFPRQPSRALFSFSTCPFITL